MRRTKTIVVISDMHCGSLFGLTPEEYHFRKSNKNYKWIQNRQALLRIQQESWNKYLELTNIWHNPDILLVNGDCIEGSNLKSHSAEVSEINPQTQCEQAISAIMKFKADKILMTFGTDYHTSLGSMDLEYSIADELDAEIAGRLFFKTEGLTIDARHKTGSSSAPGSRTNSIMKDIVWNTLKSGLEEEPKANIIIRSHIHYYSYAESYNRVGITTPSLQVSRGRYGSRQCIGETHWGAIRLTLDKGEIVRKEVRCERLTSNYHKVLRID